MSKKVFICVDENALLKPVCDYGIYTAKRLDAEAVFIHVIETPELGQNFYGLAAGGIVLGENDMVMSQYGAFDGKDNEVDEGKIKAWLDKCVDEAKAQGVSASAILRDGDFIEIIEEYKDEARIFVLGIKGTNSEDVGFNATMLIKEMKVPALLVNKDFSPINSVLVAFDGTEAAQKTLNFTKEAKLLKDAKKYVINVNNDAEESQKTLEIAREILKGENAEFVSVSGDVPGDEIIKYRRANNLDLIATGAFTKSFFKKLFVGSVSEDILHNALVPILVLS
ncbi:MULTISPECIES: universal stress protein [unclassified Campylobacter]|uniref:universal stress protein n=1 Tax=unclassified Campylobacter TaxID=2593542 RepID=UPI0022EA060D|nr:MULTISPECIES: universal stress protein [unclassified Campylobacter]MDA3043311.1 universal stress protein [Campylobacter sp. JMF_09 ED2]MDA3045000.1 universal stress protein [Campylobacter sp. JMF_07 ED4]MDA3064400.1 universal stress protein [Campylobacter sp. JMF_11 EL3]MDA3071783.1 universal stress protein [Campylobacter sp. VBCF_03 NA9]MDA3075284.1 universal stress protein [Campylobacter sp. JMF_05 ED3]